MDFLAEELSKVLSELGLKDSYNLSIIQRKRQEIFGEFLAGQLWPVRLQHGVLHLNVVSRHVLLTLNSMKKELLTALKHYGVNDLTMRLGRVPPVRKSQKTHTTGELPDLPEDLAQALEEEIKDPSLRASIEKALRASLCRK